MDLGTLGIGLTQQIAGPLVLNSGLEFNIDSGSNNYGDSIASRLSVMWQRRAYEFGLFYDIDDNSGGLMFRLNGFDYDGSSSLPSTLVNTSN